MNAAACRGAYPRPTGEEKYPKYDKFFPTRNRPPDSQSPEDVIMTYCISCKVREACDEWGDRIGATSGVWGGRDRSKEKASDPDLD